MPLKFSDLYSQPSSGNSERKRVGLYFGQTGVPALVVGTTQNLPPTPIELTDPSQLKNILKSTEHLLDKTIDHSVRAFFALGGSRMILLPLTMKTDRPSDDYSQTLLGSDSGFPNRTGFQILKNYDALSDLLVFPQAPILLEADALKGFYHSVIASVQKDPRWTLLIDSPSHSAEEKTIEWAQSFSTSLAALYYPWISVEEIGFVPTSVGISALIQTYDETYGISQCPANRPISPSLSLLNEITPESIHRLSKAGINSFRKLPQGGHTLWGCYTLDRGQSENSLLHIVRTLRSVQDAVERTCEAFLMEPRSNTICKKIKQSVDALLLDLSEQGFFASSSGNPGFRTHCDLVDSRPGAEASIHLHLEIAIERPEHFIGLRLHY